MDGIPPGTYDYTIVVHRTTPDYRELLKKYIQHVADNEGVSFLAGSGFVPDRFTPDEWAELQRLDRETE